MSQGSGSLRSADDLVYFKDTGRGVDVEKQLDELSDRERTDLIQILLRLWRYPEQLIDVRGRQGPVRAITFNGRLWVLYWVDAQPRHSPAARRISVRILVIEVLDQPSTKVPESAFELAIERYDRDVQTGANT
jgi:hypothetical protein